jgi:hypothetical protein
VASAPGIGKLTLADGLSYEGTWADGQMNGQGKLTQPNGDIYEGALVGGQARGSGQGHLRQRRHL